MKYLNFSATEKSEERKNIFCDSAMNRSYHHLKRKAMKHLNFSVTDKS